MIPATRDRAVALHMGARSLPQTAIKRVMVFGGLTPWHGRCKGERMRYALLPFVIAGVAAGCGSSGSVTDAGPDTGSEAGACSPSGSFGAPVLVPGITATAGDGAAAFDCHATLTSDETQIVFASTTHLELATRADPNAPFGAPVALASLNVGFAETAPSFGADEKTLYYAEDATGSGSSHLRGATRASPSDTSFTPLAPFAAIDAIENSQYDPAFAGTSLYFGAVTGLIGGHLYRASASDGFASPAELAELASAGGETSPAPTRDDRALYYAKFVGATNFDIWVATRDAATGAYTQMRPVSEVSSSGDDQPSWVSPDGCRLYFTSNRDGAYALYVASQR